MDEKELWPDHKLSLVDVMYGAILTIGFVEGADIKAINYGVIVRFALAYIIIVMDWLQVHEAYREERRYPVGAFVLDLFILFSISRLIYSSLQPAAVAYWGWMMGLFFLYSIWDLIMFRVCRLCRYDFKSALIIDVFDFSLAGTFFLLSSQKIVENEFLLEIPFIITYGVTLLVWEKRKR
ncbi:MAG: hypothetical protein PHI34_02265 [Acidobacteriota bacterium]|nr:hypothetical protein [Acidobacteriota bacterium]